MKLNDYMLKYSVSNTQLAKKVGCNYSYISKIRNGRTPGYWMAKKISEETKFIVKLEDLLSI